MFHSNISIIGNPNFPIRGSLIIPQEVGDINKIEGDRGAYLATLGANLQQAGFGGGTQFQEAFASGANASGVPPELYGIFVNASEALGDGQKHPERFQRKGPLRSKTADNVDEYTTPRPSLYTGVDQGTVLQDEAENLIATANEELRRLGVAQNPPSIGEQNAAYALQRRGFGLGPGMMNQLGLGPRFGNTGYPIGGGATGNQAGFGPRAGTSASFGVRVNINIRGSIGGGIGGGMGLSGRSPGGFGLNGGYAAPYSPNAALANNQYGYSKRSNALSELNRQSFGNQVDLNYFNSQQKNPYFSNGVRVGGGVSVGVGIGGGIGRPLQTQTYPNSAPLPPGFPVTPGFGAQQGGGFKFSFSVGDPPPSGYGYNPYGAGNGQNYGPGPAGFGYPGTPPGASFGGPGNGGASVMVGGAPSAFAMVSASGTLTPNGVQTTSSHYTSSSF